MDMNNNEVEIVKANLEMAKYVIEKSAEGIKYIFGSRKIRFVLAVALAVSCMNIPEEKEVVEDEK